MYQGFEAYVARSKLWMLSKPCGGQVVATALDVNGISALLVRGKQFDWSTSLRTVKSKPFFSAILRTFCTSCSLRVCCLEKIHKPAPLTPPPVRHKPPCPSVVGAPPEIRAYPSCPC